MELLQTLLLLLIVIRLYMPEKAEKTLKQANVRLKQVARLDKATVLDWTKPITKEEKAERKILKDLGRTNYGE